MKGRRRNVRSTEQRRVLCIATRRPDVRVIGTRWSARCLTVERNVRRALVHRTGVRARHAQRALVQNRHSHPGRRRLRIRCRNRKPVLVRLVFVHSIRHMKGRRRNVHSAEKRRVLCIASRRPRVRITGTRRHARRRTIEQDIRRALVHRTGVRTHNTQCATVQHRHRNVFGDIINARSRQRHRVVVVRVRIYIVRHVERRFQDSRAAQVVRICRTAASRPRVRSARRLVRHRTVQRKIGRALVHRIGVIAGDGKPRSIQYDYSESIAGDSSRCGTWVSDRLGTYPYRKYILRILVYLRCVAYDLVASKPC